jgi:hypothetical protein
MRDLAAVITILLVAAAAASQDASIWSDPGKLTDLGNERIARSDFREGLPLLQAAVSLAPGSQEALASFGNGLHLQRRLDEAAVQYERLLRIAPAVSPSKQQEDAILRFAPRVFQARTDPFPLKDVVAIHHPVQPLIAYHFFWTDDIDFPDDNDPCDHELVWVRYDPSRRAVTDFYTYFHGRLLHSSAALEDARRNEERPRVNVQWGKHGSLPFGWEELAIQADAGDSESRYLDLEKPMRLVDYNRAAYTKLRNEGRRLIDHPLSRTWPRNFEGSWNDFVDFNKEVDIRLVMKQRRTMAVSLWNNAILQQQFLAYNFRPKTEWPEPSNPLETGLELRRLTAPATDRLIEAISAPRALPEDLPPVSLFKPETPRYPNIWLYGAESEFTTYEAFIDSIAKRFQIGGFTSREVVLNEGADLALSIEHLQPWTRVSQLRHSHAIHIRFFWKRLEGHGSHRVRFGPERSHHWRVAASVHYEVENGNPLHADVEVCPVCGRTGAYAGKEGNLVERVHDPIGLELLIWGTVRGETVLGRSILAGSNETIVARPTRPDMNTEAIAIVALRTQSAMADGLPLNQIQVLGSHNSYKKAIDPALMQRLLKENFESYSALDYSHATFREQLDLGLRKLELDVVHDPNGGLYAKPIGLRIQEQESGGNAPTYDPEGKMTQPGLKLIHIPDIDFRSQAFTFRDALRELRAWSDAHPRHLPIAITMNAKDTGAEMTNAVKPLRFDSAAFDAWDAEIREIFPPEKLLTPDDVRGNFPTLEAAVQAHAWPTLGRTRGRFLFVLDETGEKLETYVAGHPSLRSRVMFVNATEGRPEAGFRIVNDPIASFHYIQKLVRSGYLVRTRSDADTREARTGDYMRMHAAFDSGAHFVSTDYYRPDPKIGSNFQVTLPGGHPGRWNPVLQPPLKNLPPPE